MIELNPDDRATTTHLYVVGVQKDGEITQVRVYASNRSQAERTAKKAGYEVRDVNMEG